jgi:glutamate synthase (ferredoxin)
MNRCPHKQGLYDPAFEKDACGTGFVVDIQGRKSHKIVQQALQALDNLRHRGACGCEENTGDGAGILIQIPHTFLKEATKKAGFQLPSYGEYGVGMAFLPKIAADQKECQKRLESIVVEEGQAFLGWRAVPTDNSTLGESARAAEPAVKQFFIGRNSALKDDLSFERKLYVIRKRAEAAIRYSGWKGGYSFYISSLSHRTLVYKGMLISNQVPEYFPDLRDPALDSALALVHSRFSTNTFPSWDRAHPYRYIAHNGEINTLRGNVNWMFTRQALFKSDLFGDDLKKVLPIVRMDGSDSAIFDNTLEFLALSGRSLAHAMMMMIPEPWQNHESMTDEKKAFYEYHASLMEPWDGPASIAFTDGLQVGAVLDRNGLRPSRYYVTKDDLVVMASEVGVLDIPPERILHKGRLQPGRMFLIDTVEKRIVADEEIKHKICSEKPYRLWIKENLVKLEDLQDPPQIPEPDHQTMLLRQQAFGYTFEDLRIVMAPMAESSVEPIGSMGDDTPLAVLSDKPHLLYDYFKQLFAQVTNPPIDGIREEIVTGSETTIGPEANLLDPRPESARQIQLKAPVLTDEEFYKLVHVNHPWFRSRVFPMIYPVRAGGAGLEKALKDLFAGVDKAIDEGINIIILSDRMMDRDNAAIPALLASAGLHHHLIRRGTRTKVGLILESGEPREVHHFALLIGYGVGAINPYLALESLDDMIRQGILSSGMDHKKAVKNYVKAASKGVLKVISKMGISTIQSYQGAQIFEAIGLNQDVIDKYFCWTPSRIAGVGIDTLAKEVELRHHHAFPEYGSPNGQTLDPGGKYQYRKDGEYHLFNPETIHYLQTACRTNNFELFKKYSALVNDQSKRLATLRGLMEFQNAQPVPIDEVESVEAIMKRFKTGAMSYGSISKEAHESLAVAMNRVGGRSNTGEGGEDPERYKPMANGDSKNSAIKQVASGRFGVTSQYLTQAKELQIKMAQGAKPGEGGQLPGKKVYPWIAKVRYSTPGVGLISPPPHHDIYSIEDLAELIHDLKNANHNARINVKLVSEVGVGTIAAGVAKGHADVVLISGHDGGTGASPQTAIKNAGLPWELGLAETHQTLVLNKLRDRIVVETDGQLKTGRDIAVATLLGAEEYGFATAPLVVMGCIMMRVCHLDTCPVGVATQNPELRKRFTGDPAHVVTFMRFIAQELREIMAQLGFRTINEMVGQVNRLKMKAAVDQWKAKGLDISKILYEPPMGPEVGRYCKVGQNHGLDQALDRTALFEICKPALDERKTVKAQIPIRNVNRVVGTMVGSELTRRFGPEGLPEDTIQLHFQGSAGQSFSAFVPKGMTMILEGDGNDYVGKGLSGGKIIVYPPKSSTFIPEENILIGNVAFYGATDGEAYIRGMAGERFCVRNSGVRTVVEGVGDHGCEYMTGGRVVVLGHTGRNFAAGMSGGIAYVLDMQGTFPVRCNKQMVGLESLEDPDEISEVKAMVERHARYTGSLVAERVLSAWPAMVSKFVKVLPKDYKRALEAEKRVRAQGLSGDEAIMAAFKENVNDVARVGGN